MDAGSPPLASSMALVSIHGPPSWKPMVLPAKSCRVVMPEVASAITAPGCFWKKVAAAMSGTPSERASSSEPMSCRPKVSSPEATMVMLLMSKPPGRISTSRPSAEKKPWPSAAYGPANCELMIHGRRRVTFTGPAGVAWPQATSDTTNNTRTSERIQMRSCGLMGSLLRSKGGWWPSSFPARRFRRRPRRGIRPEHSRGTATGLTNGQADVEADLGSGIRLPGDEAAEQGHRLPAHPAGGQRDAGQRRLDDGGEVDLAEADDGEVASDMQAAGSGGLDGADGQDVTRGEDGGRRVGLIEQARRCPGAGLEG